MYINQSTCICGCGSGPCVPQRPYRHPKADTSEGDHIGELITFEVYGRCGMPLRDALRCKYLGLSGRDDPVFVGSQNSVRIRLEVRNPVIRGWGRKLTVFAQVPRLSVVGPAGSHCFSLLNPSLRLVQMRTKDWKRKPSPITKAKLATEIAKTVDRFLKVNLQCSQTVRNSRKAILSLQDMRRNTMSLVDVDINHLALVALEHMSFSSWQPHLRLMCSSNLSP